LAKGKIKVVAGANERSRNDDALMKFICTYIFISILEVRSSAPKVFRVLWGIGAPWREI